MAISCAYLRSLVTAAVMVPAILIGQGEAKTPEKSKSPTSGRPAAETKEQAATYTGIATDKLQRQSEKLSDKRDGLQDEIDRFKEFGLRAKAAQEALQKSQPPNVDSD